MLLFHLWKAPSLSMELFREWWAGAKVPLAFAFADLSTWC